MSNQSGQDKNSPESYGSLGWLYDKITGDEDARVCKDIPEEACIEQPRNFFAYLVANIFTKIADELSSARLVLPWLLGALGTPSVFLGFLVPIRESGVLIPQLVVAAYARRLAIRKVVWLVGAALSSIALLLMAFATTLGIKGSQAGWTIIILLSMFSLARGLCSVSAKDVLGKTISKTRRGTLMGYSTAVSSLFTLFIGLYINNLPESSELFSICLFSAAILWVVAIVSFSGIKEEPGATEGGANALTVAIESIGIIKRDRAFRQFVSARAMLLSVALAPPFYVLLAQQYTNSASGLGLLIVSSGLAGSLSAPFWGKMGDKSSKSIMVIAAIGAGATGLLVFIADYIELAALQSVWTHVSFFFLIALFHSGARLGRKVYLVDMSNSTNRAQYVAVSNTVIGLAMLLCGGIGIVGDLVRTSTILGLLGATSLMAALYINLLEDVSG